MSVSKKKKCAKSTDAHSQTVKNTDTFQVQSDEVLRELFDQARYDGDGASHTARVNALKLIADHLGMFEKKSRSEGEKGEAVVYDIRFDCDKKEK
jgi:hypothetical protein